MAEPFDWANYDWGQGTPGLMARPKNDAMSMGLLAAGLGILANNRGNYGQLAPALGAGGLQGLSTYSNMLQQDRQSKMDESRLSMEQQRQQMLAQQMELQKMALAKQRAQKEYFQNAFSGGGGQLAQGAAVGDVGPTNTNAARSTGNPMDMLTPEQRFIVQGHIGAENYPEALKAMNEYLKPIVAGDKVLQIRNGTAQPVPGSVQTHGAFTRESERAKGEFTPFMGVQNEQGQAVPMTTAGFAERFGRSQTAPQQSGPSGLEGLPPEIANAIKNDMMRTGVKSANYQFGPTDARAGTPVSPANIRTGQISMGNGQPSAGGMPAVSGPTIEQKEVAPKIAQDLGKQFVERLFTGYDSATKGLESLRTIDESRKAIAGGAYIGSGANLKLDTLKGIEGIFGIRVDPAKMANTDALISTLGESMTGRVKELGVNPTDADRRIMEKIVGTIGKDPKALENLLDWQEGIIIRGIESHNRRAKQAEEGGNKFMYPLTVEIPQRSKPSAAPQGATIPKFNPATGKIEVSK